MPGAARHIRETMASDSTLMLAEPYAGDGPGVLWLLHAVCTSAPLAQPVGAAEMPFNLILEARPRTLTGA